MAVILGGNDTLPQITLTQSQTFVPPQDGNVCIHVIAGGGAGYAGDTNLSGGAGGYSKKTTLAVTTAGSFTVVVGVGGVGNRNGATPAAGGNSTVAGTGLSATITANGGAGATANANGGGGAASRAASALTVTSAPTPEGSPMVMTIDCFMKASRKRRVAQLLTYR